MSQHRLVSTTLGRVSVRCTGSGPTALLWPSLFVDDRSWERVEPGLARHRRLVVLSGPGHGASEDPGRRYSIEECAAAARDVLDALDVQEPVDWVGNAWGGHVGVVFTTSWPDRCRSLVAIGTPVRALDRAERRQTLVLLAAHRFLGLRGFIRRGVVEALLSPATRAGDPEAVRLVEDCLTAFDRAALRNAVVSVSVHRHDLTALLPRVAVPTLWVTGSEHSGFTPAEATAAAALVPQGSAAVVAGAAYLPPLEAPEETVRLISGFWAEHALPSPTS
jgi:pimeloyl-ACP methyl ester carboxylesterase